MSQVLYNDNVKLSGWDVTSVTTVQALIIYQSVSNGNVGRTYYTICDGIHGISLTLEIVSR